MVEHKSSKLKLLETDLPEGLLVDAAWLEAKGIPSNLRAYYVKNGWLEQPVRSVYRRPRGSLSWQQVVISLQTILETPLIVGGKTALELQGFAHYLSRVATTVHLYGPSKPPSWLGKLELPQRFVFRNSETLFRNDPIIYGPVDLARGTAIGKERNLNRWQGVSLTELSWGHWDWPLTLSQPERAYLEMLNELPRRESFHQADMIMQGGANFSPRRLQKLLNECASIKVKRLFFLLCGSSQSCVAETYRQRGNQFRQRQTDAGKGWTFRSGLSDHSAGGH